MMLVFSEYFEELIGGNLHERFDVVSVNLSENLSDLPWLKKFKKSGDIRSQFTLITIPHGDQ